MEQVWQLRAALLRLFIGIAWLPWHPKAHCRKNAARKNDKERVHAFGLEEIWFMGSGCFAGRLR
jgi:hypothetical protein